MNYASFALIRFGTGLSPRFAGPETPDALLESLRDDAVVRKFPAVGDARAADLARAFAIAKRDEEAGKGSAEAFAQAEAALDQAAIRALRARAARALDDPTGFADRLALFWSNHFSIREGGQNLRILTAAFHEDAIRGHQRGRFADLLRAATLHPAMLVYLDQTSSYGPHSKAATWHREKQKKQVGLNENHARELLELHSMGVGSAYGQQDVRQLARLMTGLMVDADRHFIFQPNRAEPGPDTVLGIAYGGGEPAQLGEVVEFLEDLAVRPETARFICTKLARHFCADDPPAALVGDMVARYRETGGQLMAVYDVMVRHPVAAETFGRKVRQPQDLILAWMRALQIDGPRLFGLPMPELKRSYLGPLHRMGQVVTGAPQPEGWPEQAQSWLSPQLLAARIDWAMTQPSLLLDALPDPRNFAGRFILGEERERVRDLAARAESAADGIGLVLASPQFNRR